ncbi:MAG: hypothetical protein WC686_01885 [Candidatus Shapirobacteria bacterium]|jgi:hypothetical protein
MKISIFGYTSPDSRVEINNPDIFNTVVSDASGFFSFDRVTIPQITTDICFSSTDNSNRRSFPTCLPPPPSDKPHVAVGPILLPPTLSLNSATIKPGQTHYVSGKTYPNSIVRVYYYKLQEKGKSFPKAAMAYSLPHLTLQSDASGRFTLSLPTAVSSNFRLFSVAYYFDAPSPKSNSLTYILPNLFQIFWQKNTFFILFLPLYFITLVAFSLVIYYYFNPYALNRLPLFKTKSKKHQLVSYRIK